jgi:hypothetical protein
LQQVQHLAPFRAVAAVAAAASAVAAVVVVLAVFDPRARARVLHLATRAARRAAGDRVHVAHRAREDEAEDLVVGVPVRGEAAPAADPVLVQHPQRAEARAERARPLAEVEGETSIDAAAA